MRTDALVVSVDYRHSPEHPFPAAVDDGVAALRWVAEHAAELGGRPDRLAVAGWSAGGNIAAVVCRLARDHGGPRILGQALLTCSRHPPIPVAGAERRRLRADGQPDGVVRGELPRRRRSRRSAAGAAAGRRPVRTAPAVVVTCEFDPLRDGGDAYAAAHGRGGGSDRACAGPRPHPPVTDDGRPGGFRRAGAREFATALRLPRHSGLIGSGELEDRDHPVGSGLVAGEVRRLRDDIRIHLVALVAGTVRGP